MKKFYSVLLVLAISQTAICQVVHEINVASFSFNPSSIEIATGDMVRWTNSGGSHSVDGNTTTFPDNPEAFGNSISSSAWVYEFSFNLPGTYNYRCGLHTQSMFGSVTVVGEPLSIDDEHGNQALSFYPNPANQYLNWKWQDTKPSVGAKIKLINIVGQQILQAELKPGVPINLGSQASGIYFYQVFEGNELIQTGRIVIKQD